MWLFRNYRSLNNFGCWYLIVLFCKCGNYMFCSLFFTLYMNRDLYVDGFWAQIAPFGALKRFFSTFPIPLLYSFGPLESMQQMSQCNAIPISTMPVSLNEARRPTLSFSIFRNLPHSSIQFCLYQNFLSWEEEMHMKWKFGSNRKMQTHEFLRFGFNALRFQWLHNTATSIECKI